jgi:SEC-C motif-containing protein
LPLPFAQCCGLYVEAFDSRPAPDAQALMRSRYSAFVLERGEYLLSTWHQSRRPSKISFDPGVKWLGLAVREVKALDADHAEVEFVARQRDKSGRAVRLHERSRFVREEGRWYYVDGDWL